MNATKRVLLATAIAAVCTPALAEDAVWKPSANVALTSDYIWRGVTQTMEDPAIQGGFDLNHASGFYVGTWGSNVRFVEEGAPSDGANVELDLYAGFGGSLANGVAYDLRYTRFLYPNGTDLDFGEFQVSGTFKDVTLLYAFSPDVGAVDTNTHYVELGYKYALPNDFSLGVNAGYYSFDDDGFEDYANWKLSIGKTWSGFDFSLAYTDTDLKDNELADGRAVFTIAKKF